ncbi:hypothetical protein DPX16_23820 [Anabarilius grahami]|uniref:Uncharacterized protein n=1 Tax=Anabarilius grahami TaxID=495550 RepID=A0A3N0Z4U7_ANAGA|nr:hypothetical protein DPX16_23820 [Anabarilius grahami]
MLRLALLILIGWMGESFDYQQVIPFPGSSGSARRGEKDAINHILAERDKNSMLEIKYINPVKGRGIFTFSAFNQGDFVVEYRGELIDAAEAEHRHKLYHNVCSIFMFDFIWKRKTWWCIVSEVNVALRKRGLEKLVSSTRRCHPLCSQQTFPVQNSASFPSGQLSVAELGDHAHDLEPNVSSTDFFRDTKSRAECQSSSPTPDSPEHEVHCVRGQCGTEKEGIGEVGVQHQEVSPPVFSTDLSSGFRVSSRRCVKRPWSEEEIQAVMKHIRPFIENCVTVTSEQCLKCKEKEQPILETRSIQNIRDFVCNRAFKMHSNAKH